MIPSSNTTMEAEFGSALTGIATVHAARVGLRLVTLEELTRLEAEAVVEAKKLADAGVNIIAYGCTSGGFVRSPHQHMDIERAIEEGVGVPCVAAAGAVVRALRSLGVKKVDLVTPYIPAITKLEELFLESYGFKVVDSFSASLLENTAIGRIQAHEVSSWVRCTDYSNADVVFISCTNLPTFHVIEGLEDEVGRPVVSSNSATLWDVLRRLGVAISDKPLGRLFKVEVIAGSQS